MKTIRTYFTDGNSLVTSINGSEEEILGYYVGRYFELTEGELSLCNRVEFLK
jgi:hypothetical protein